MAAPAYGWWPTGWWAAWHPQGWWPERNTVFGLVTAAFAPRRPEITLTARKPDMAFAARRPTITFRSSNAD